MPTRIKQMRVEQEMTKDGKEIYTVYLEQTADTDAAARSMGQVPLTFSSALDELEIQKAYTAKVDGTRRDVDVKAIVTELLPGASNLAMFNDMRRKVIIFPDVAAGDSIVYQFRRVRAQPLLKGHFLSVFAVPPTTPIEKGEFVFRLPPGTNVAVDSTQISYERSTGKGSVEISGSYSNSKPATEDKGVLSGLDRYPRFFVSTVKDWSELSRLYAAQVLPKIMVTPAITAKAQEITAGAASQREKVRLLYKFVSSQIRYVAIFFGHGPILPHDAETVLKNGYGDCKDHAVLFTALLKAVGIEAETVLINGTNGYTVAKVPTIANFNHMITYIPELSLYADTTGGFQEFGRLPYQQYGKPVLHVTATGSDISRTPPAPADTGYQELVTKAVLTEDGVMSGKSYMLATGDFQAPLRGTGQNIRGVGLDRAAESVKNFLGFQGALVLDAAPDPRADADQYRLSGSFSHEARPEIMEGAPFTHPAGMALLARPGDFLLGGLFGRTPASEATPCYPGRQVSVLTLTLPAGRQLASLPKGRKISTSVSDYEVQWSQAGQDVTVRREFISRATGPLCEGPLRDEIVKAHEAIRADYRVSIALAPK